MTDTPALNHADRIIGEVLPSGYAVRAPRLVGDDGGPDVDAAYAVVSASETRVSGSNDQSRGEILGGLTGHESDLDGSRIVFDRDARPIGYLCITVDWESHLVLVDAYAADVCGSGSTPAGLLEAFLRAGIARAGEITRTRRAEFAHTGDQPWRVAVGALENDSEYRDVIVSVGLEPVRVFYRMRIGFGVPAAPPVIPSDVTISVATSEEDRRLIHDVHERSFADHWDYTPHSLDSFIDYATSAFGYDPSRWWLLRVDGALAGLCIGTDESKEFGDGYIKWLGILREFRGRGLAKLLLHNAFYDYSSHGYVGVRLGVDAANPTGATHLYESMGMAPIEAIHVYSRDLS